MTLRSAGSFLLLALAFLTACGAPSPEAALPTSTPLPGTATPPPSTETSTAIPFTELPPVPTQDPALFGAIGVDEIQAPAIEPIAGGIFTRVMNGYLADDRILDFQITGVTVFPGEGGLRAEISFNVRTTDPAWLADGGTPADNDWINDKCSRFDFVTTETEYQLKNRRSCN